MTDSKPAPERLMLKLLPCPFCGCPAETCIRDGEWVVGCQHCGASGPSHDTSEEAEVVWNTRHTQSAAIALADREAAERIEAGPSWEEYERLRGAAFNAHFACGEHRDDDGPYEPLAKAATEAGAALDAFVRRLLASGTAAPPSEQRDREETP